MPYSVAALPRPPAHAPTPSPVVRRLGALVCIALTAMALSAQPALASANIEGLLQNVVDMLTGNTARLLAVLAVVIVGILWMFGLFDLRRAAIVVLGIVVVFGAAEIVSLITGGA
jgi:type IV secretory pathway VirB2 component (pilin)